MSKAPAKAEAAEGEAPAKGGKKKLIIIIVAVLILAIAGGAAFMLLGKKKHADGEEEEEPAAAHEPPKVKVDPSKPPVFVQLEQFTVNLSPEEGEHFLQATMVLRVADAKVAMIVAFLNHGNGSNGTASSSAPMRSQKPWADTFVTSTSKVTVPGILNLLDVCLNDGVCIPNLGGRQTDVDGQLYVWHDPELRLTIRMGNMDVNSCLLAREEKRRN